MNYLTNLKDIIISFYPWSIFITLIIFIISFAHPYIDSTNPASRFLTMESIVEKHSLTINNKHFFTDDKIFRNNNFYSSKPPFLSILGAGIYYGLHNLFHLSFPDQPYFWQPNLSVYLITLLLTGLPFIILALYFYKTLNFLQVETKYQIWLLIGLTFGSLYFSYSITFNNHIIAGCFLYISFYYLIQFKFNKKNHYLFWSGFLAGLAATMELPPGLLFCTLSFFYLLIALRLNFKQIIFYILGVIPPLIIHLWLNQQITGDFLPPQLHSEYWHIGADYWNSDRLLPLTLSNVLIYIFNILIGSRGLFLYSPILIFSFYGLYKVIKIKNHPFRTEAILILAEFIILLLFYSLLIRRYSGSAFGFRWFIAITPLIYFFTSFLFINKHFKLFHPFIIILIFSILISLLGFINPWPWPYVNLNNKIIIDFPLLANLSSL